MVEPDPNRMSRLVGTARRLRRVRRAQRRFVQLWARERREVSALVGDVVLNTLAGAISSRPRSSR